MKRNKKFNCVLIGTQSRLIKCAEILINSGHNILAVVSNDVKVLNWAKDNFLEEFHIDNEWEIKIEQLSFDYLFSIDNPVILPEHIRKQPRHLAINFHDSLLPKYAGVNATFWAIMNGEKTHGISWHIMEEKVDTGDILKQLTFPIRNYDTTFTLNGICFEKSIESFSDLISELVADKIRCIPQEISSRSYYKRWQRPTAACTIDCRMTANEIDCLFRSLDFGTYKNPMGLPKLFLGDRFEVVKECEVLETKHGTPGSIVHITNSSIDIATASYIIRLKDFYSSNCIPESTQKIINDSRLSIGDTLPTLNKVFSKTITELNTKMVRYESFWSNILGTLEPLSLEYFKRNVHNKSNSTGSFLYKIAPTSFSPPGNNYHGDKVLATLSIYFSRICNSTCFDIAYSDSSIKQLVKSCETLFASSVPLHIEIDPNQSFHQIEPRIFSELEKIKKHGTYPLDLILREPELRERDKDRFRMQVAIERVAQLTDKLAKSDYDLEIVIPDDGEKLCWKYKPEVFDTVTIENMINQFTIFCGGIVDNYYTKVSHIPLLSVDERDLLLNKWSRQKVETGKGICLHEAFEKAVLKYPDKVAAIQVEDVSSVSSQKEISYDLLNIRTNRLARYLQQQQVEAGTIVGICLERSIESLTAILAVHKAGGAFLILDPHLPPERLQFMVTDADIKIIVTLEHFQEILNSCKVQTVALDSTQLRLDKYDGQNLGCYLNEDDLAYVVYTSGSTGLPKGVLIEQRGLKRLVAWHMESGFTTEDDRIMHSKPLSFDASYAELIRSFAVGATLIIVPEKYQKEVAATASIIQKFDVTTFSIVPSMLAYLLDEPELNKCNKLNTITVGGEALPVELRNKVLTQFDVKLINFYGPTEATIVTLGKECKMNNSDTSVPIGRPIANARVFIVDSNLQLLPPGCPGELLIGGDCVGRGYLNRPELTEEKFIRSPFGNGLLYRTGDLVRYQPGGDIEFLGRIDNQVKIHGLRIELGEIEAQLKKFPGIIQAAVLVQKDKSGNSHLTSYLVADSEISHSYTEVSEFLKSRLPDYMVPRFYMFLDALPITPNGKLDTKVMNSLKPMHIASENEFVAPRNSVEKKMVDIWKEILGVSEIGVHDNFFDSGGDSLNAVQLFCRYEESFRKKLPLATLFRAPTIAELAEMISADTEKDEWALLVPIKTSGTNAPLYFLHAHEGNVLGYYELAQQLDHSQPFYGIQAKGLDGNIPDDITCFEDMATNYIREIKQVQQQGPYLLGGYCLGGVIAFEMAQQLKADGENVELILIHSHTHNYPQYPKPSSLLMKWYSLFDQRINTELEWFKETNRGERIKHLFKRIHRLFTIVRLLLEKPLITFLSKIKVNIKTSQTSQFEELGKKHVSLLRRYKFKPYDGNVILINAAEQPAGIIPDKSLGWKEIVKGKIDIYEIPGYRLTMLMQPRVELVGKKLKAALKLAADRILDKG